MDNDKLIQKIKDEARAFVTAYYINPTVHDLEMTEAAMLKACRRAFDTLVELGYVIEKK
jgi:hypothetical protein